MNIKKDVHKRIITKLEKERGILRHKIFRNKLVMANIVKDQTLNKRELAELQKLIKLIEGKG